MDKTRKENDELLKQFETRISSHKEKDLYNAFQSQFKDLRVQMKKAQDLGLTNNEEAYSYYLKEIDPNMEKQFSLFVNLFYIIIMLLNSYKKRMLIV